MKKGIISKEMTKEEMDQELRDLYKTRVPYIPFEDIHNEAFKRYPFNFVNGVGTYNYDIFIEGVDWALEQIKIKSIDGND